jgi:tRNA/tmRNA/rRNA uracil-C5-methylase (TrmA/RlmC/RlmD family)
MASDHPQMEKTERKADLSVGQRFVVTIEKIAHGGHFIARHLGAVIFVRHAIPGEEVEIEITSTGSSFNRADVVKVLSASSDRVSAPCQFAHRAGCGGCDFQHISSQRQRKLKSEVITEQFARIAKKELTVQVEEVGEPLGYRTRFTAVTTRNGAIGFRQARSNKVVPVSDCRILQPELNFHELSNRKWRGDLQVEVSISSTGERTIATALRRDESPARTSEGPDIAKYVVNGVPLEVSQRSFWQSHKDAPLVLTEAVSKFAQVQSGDHLLDLYGGVGLFSSQFLEQIGASGRIDLVEGSKSATSDAIRNFAEQSNVGVHNGDVEKILPRFSKADVIILDPPREGAGKNVVESMVSLKPRAIIYVACDPAALARDCAYLESSGYGLADIRAFDLFPMTQHIESVALFKRVKVS